jgi:hypothetical protein
MSHRLSLRVGVTGVLLFLVLGAAGSAQAPPGLNCDICELHVLSGIVHTILFCKPVPHDGTVGVTQCTIVPAFGGGTDCQENGNACAVIDADPGGVGIPGGGSGGNPCRTAHFCPAECFSCSP